MQSAGTPLKIVRGTLDLGDPSDPKSGLFLVLIQDNTSRHDVEALVDHLQLNNVQALVVMESAIKEVRQLHKIDLNNLKLSIEEALTHLHMAEEADHPSEVTATRVVATLERRPSLMRGVYDLLHSKFGPFVPSEAP